MALETDNPQPKRPKEPQAKDVLVNQEHDTTSGGFYGTTEGVKESDTQFEMVEVPKKVASNVAEPKVHDVEEDESRDDPAKKAAAEKSRAKAQKKLSKADEPKQLPRASSADKGQARKR